MQQEYIATQYFGVPVFAIKKLEIMLYILNSVCVCICNYSKYLKPILNNFKE